MMRPFHFFAALVIASLAAQEKTTPDEKMARFTSNANLVVVDVYARDKSGKPVLNLKKEDFTILEDGKAQTISVFELQRLDGEVLPSIAEQPKTLVERNTSAPKPPPVQGPLKFRDRRLITLFFDFSSMQPDDQIRAQDAAVHFLQTRMTASDLVSIMAYGAEIKTIEDFTDDRERLIADIRKFQVGAASEMAGLGDTGAAAEGDDTGSFVADETEFNIFNTDQKLAALESAARKLAVFPEKKALVYFSSGIPKTGVENQSQLRATVNAAVRANVAFYPVDATGLVAEAPSGDASVASPRGTGVFTGTHQRGRVDARNNQQETLVTLAADTGGQALLDNNDLGLGIVHAQKDINSYYIIGYYSTNSAKDGKYRRIQVKLNNKTLQVKLDHRNGYYSDKLFAKFTSADKERQLQDALMLGDPVSELPLALEIDHFRIGKDRYFVPISVKIPGSAINLAKKGDRESVELDFIGQVRDKSGRLVTAVRDGITAKLGEANASQLGRRSFQYDTGLTLAPGEYSLRFLARENLNGKMGTFETKFSVPDLNTQTNTVRLSSIIWSSQREPLSDIVGAAGKNKKEVANHPLVQNGEKLVPSVTHVFRKDQNLYVYLEVYDPIVNAERKTANVTAELALFRGGRKAFESNMIQGTTLVATRPGVLPLQFQLALVKFNPGAYTAQINVVDELGRKFAFPRATFVVLP
ncbi:MAG TPA: VWA domain-containing protein [Bryobacteraceae bacterium]|nr:VWA domain-containing protein [Bryobacteraceae bacterium]